MEQVNKINLDKLVIKKHKAKKVNEDGQIIHKTIKRDVENVGISMAHLHLHTFHSILDGCGSIDNYIELAKRYGHPAIGITDHGTMSGTFEFFQKCKAAGIKPLIGSELYVNDKMGLMEHKKDEGKNSHLIVYAMNEVGYQNLNKLLYRSFDEGFYRRGRIKSEWLFENKEGLFVSSACIGNSFARLFLENKSEEAEVLFAKYKEEFGENFAAEIQINELEIQVRYNNWLISMANKYNVMLILTNDVHYAFPQDAELQDVLIAINHHSTVGSSFKLHVRNLFYTNSLDFQRFNTQFGYNYPPEFIDLCLQNTLTVVEKCNFEFEIGKEKYPRYEVTKDVSDYFQTTDTVEIITKLAFAKLRQKINIYKKNNIVKITDEVTKEYVNRLNYEISVIEDKKMLDYFLVNWEIIRDYRSKGYSIGPGRGCFKISSRVKMIDGMYAPIETIAVGEEVIDVFGKPQKVLNVFEYDVDEDIMELEFENEVKIECTVDHEFLTKGRGWVEEEKITEDYAWVEAKKLNSKDRVIDIENHGTSTLKSRKIKNYKGKVYDLEVENSHSYNIEGLGVHNSAAGSLLSWCLDIVSIDPIRFGLYFERFLNPTRNCLTKNNKVLLKNGEHKNIMDINLKDDKFTIQTEKGKGELVQIHEKEIEEEVFQIETENGAMIELTGDHIVPVLRDGKRIEIKIKEINIYDYLLTF